MVTSASWIASRRWLSQVSVSLQSRVAQRDSLPARRSPAARLHRRAYRLHSDGHRVEPRSTDRMLFLTRNLTPPESENDGGPVRTSVQVGAFYRLRFSAAHVINVDRLPQCHSDSRQREMAVAVQEPSAPSHPSVGRRRQPCLHLAYPRKRE